MANWFNRVQKLPHVGHSVNDESYDVKTSINIGDLVPINVMECLPSDKFLKLGSEVYLRFAPLQFPLMHRIKVKTHNFFTPIRIILGEDNYKDFLNGQKSIQTLNVITTTSSNVNPFINSIFDYLMIDVFGAVSFQEAADRYTWTLAIPNPTPYFAYLMIIRDWFTDSTLNEQIIAQIDTFVKEYQDCITDQAPCTLRYFAGSDALGRCFDVSYSKDYFNTARPTPQLGSDMYVLNRPLSISDYVGGQTSVGIRASSSDTPGQLYANNAPISEGTTIRDLWRKEAMQIWEQHGNSFGSRVREQLAAHFGILISDKRLQIPQYCGGSTTFAQVSEVIQTSASEDTSALGAFAGKASAFSRNAEHNYFCEEHGVMLTLLSLVPDNGYCRGMQRLYFKQDVFDFAFPEFNNIGWQEIKNGELFYDGAADSDDPNGAWGYQPRYSEYRSMQSRVTGQFRTSSLLAWHLARNFDNLPPLNSEFLKVADTNRIFNMDGLEANECPIFVDAFNDIKMSRPISKEPDSVHLY